MADESELTGQEFQGIRFLDGGGLRLSHIQIVADSSGVRFGQDLKVEIRSETWHHWIALSARHAWKAEQAKASNPGTTDLPGFDLAIQSEYREALVSMTSAAVALEAFKSTIVQMVPRARVSARSADARVHQTLVIAFRLKNEISKGLRKDLQQVFRLRDQAVHPSAAFATPVRHPEYPIALDPKFLWFTSANATTVFDTVTSYLKVCLRSPRKTFAELETWCGGALRTLDEASRDRTAVEQPPQA